MGLHHGKSLADFDRFNRQRFGHVVDCEKRYFGQSLRQNARELAKSSSVRGRRSFQPNQRSDQHALHPLHRLVARE